MKLIKLLRQPSMPGFVGESYNRTLWKIGSTVQAQEAIGTPWLCSPRVIHAYRSIYHAVLFCGKHGFHLGASMFEAEGEVAIEDVDKVGVRELTLTKKIDWPAWTLDYDSYRRFVVQVALEVMLFYVENVYASRHCAGLSSYIHDWMGLAESDQSFYSTVEYIQFTEANNNMSSLAWAVHHTITSTACHGELEGCLRSMLRAVPSCDLVSVCEEIERRLFTPTKDMSDALQDPET